jgi:D-sedoheptulose 7-phosphate isomerase
MIRLGVIIIGASVQQNILSSIEDGVRAIEFLKLPQSLEFIEKASLALCESFEKGGKVLVAGNGGSLCDAMHFAEELTGFYRSKRPALGAIALADPGHISCVANDVGFDFVFSRGVEALGRAGDVLVVLTTSGNSTNLIEAVKAAKSLGMYTIGFLGKTGGKLKGLTDLELIIEGFVYSDRIQEAHMTVIHILIEMVEKKLFFEKSGEFLNSSCCYVN